MFDLFSLTPTQYHGLQLLAYVCFTLLVGLGIGRWVKNQLNYYFNRGFGRIVIGRNNLKALGNGRFLLQLRNLFEEMPLSTVVLDPILREKAVAAGKHCSEEQPFPILATDAEQTAWLDANLGYVAKVNQAGEIAESLHQPVVTKWVWLVPACSDGAKGTIRKFRTIWIGDDTLDKCSDPSVFEYERQYHYTRGNTLAMIYKAVRENGGCIMHGKRHVQIAVKIEIKAPKGHELVS